jgi:hypothetical protein
MSPEVQRVRAFRAGDDGDRQEPHHDLRSKDHGTTALTSSSFLEREGEARRAVIEHNAGDAKLVFV